jgi:hypothetical protein
VAATFDGSQLVLYVDAKRVASAAVSGPLVTSTGSLEIGADLSLGENFIGRIDNIRIFSRPRSAKLVLEDGASPVLASTGVRWATTNHAPTAIEANHHHRPVNTAPPTISGTLEVGQTLSATQGQWIYDPTRYAYQWQACGTVCLDISGATGSTYTLQSSDDKQRIDVAVTATNAGGSATATSAPTPTVAAPTPPPPVNTALPGISGTPQQGQTLTATPGTWMYSPTYAYQWQDCGTVCVNISGATGSTYTLQSSDVNQKVDVAVTATNAGGSASAVSPTVGPVSAVNPPVPPPPSISAVNTNVMGTSATFTATINPNGIATTVFFEYGTTTTYGSTTPNQNIGSGTTPQTVTATVTGLTPGTTYHVRAAATQ